MGGTQNSPDLLPLSKGERAVTAELHACLHVRQWRHEQTASKTSQRAAAAAAACALRVLCVRSVCVLVARLAAGTPL